MNIFDKITYLQEKSHGYHAIRATTQLRYAYRISEVNDFKYNDIVLKAADVLLGDLNINGSITKNAAKECEDILSVLSEEAKKYTMICIAHAHIDMNWMWSYNETVAITLDTFRTMLKMLREYPQFTFSQSQASTYKIVEKHDPEMFEEIKEMVKMGRWEVTASTWVEGDKNMTSGESQARHILYTKKYFKEKFGIPFDSILLDYEPDTFGHNAQVPEILEKGGIKYYYHCRGSESHCIYNWKSPSGASVLVFREPDWYNTIITYDYADYLPSFCKEHDIDRLIRVYGVGDHGGGPTRRDIERLIDMSTWPCYAKIEFGSYRTFFEYLETKRENFPTVEGELNFVFTGCYSSESRIKMANRMAEDSLNTAETLTALANAFANGKPYTKGYTKAWIKTLFNHFHDILPGSGIRETREHALAYLQEVLGYTYAGRSKSLIAFAESIDTSSIKTEDDKESFADGAGMGFKGVAQQNSALVRGLETQIVNTGCGKTRIFHIFNTTAYDRSEALEFPIWDYPGKLEKLEIKDADGNDVPFYISKGGGGFWAHTCVNITAFVTVPAFGYITLIAREGESKHLPYIMYFWNPRVEYYQDFVLENDRIVARFDRSMQLVSLVDKKTNKEMINEKSGFFSLCWQNHKLPTVTSGNAWVEGYVLKEQNINENYPVFVTEMNNGNDIRKYICYEMDFGKSKISVTVSLDRTSSVLKYKVDADWHEIFTNEEGIPALKFLLPFGFEVDEYEYEIAFGTVKRSAHNHDVPSIGFGAVHDKESNRSLILMTDSIYAYRGENNSFSLTLLRASQSPDMYPEYGMHSYNIGIGICDKDEYFRYSDTFNYPLYFITNTSHKGSLPLKNSFISTSKNIAVSTLKTSEDENGFIVRVFDISKNGGMAFIQINADFEVTAVDNLERPIDKEVSRDGSRVLVNLSPCETIALKVTLNKGVV